MKKIVVIALVVGMMLSVAGVASAAKAIQCQSLPQGVLQLLR